MYLWSIVFLLMTSTTVQSFEISSSPYKLIPDTKSVGSTSMIFDTFSSISCISICINYPENCNGLNIIEAGSIVSCEILTIVTDIVTSKDTKTHYNRTAYHLVNGYELFENYWLKGFAQNLGVIEAVKLCTDKNAEFWIPRSTAENEYIQNVMSGTSIEYMWYPVNDTETEGIFRYVNGDEVSPADNIPWGNYSTYGFDNSNSFDCAQMEVVGTITMYACNDMDAGIVCRSML